MSLRQRIQDDMKSALKAGDKSRLGTIRLMHAAVQQREIDERIELDDAQVLETLDKMVKQRRESITQYDAGNRADLAAIELAEIEIIQQYLPEPLSESALDAVIDGAITETGAAGMRDMGKVMGIVKPAVQGRADMGTVSAKVKAKLGS
jgi:hypothetical protein